GDTNFWVAPHLQESSVYKAASIPGRVSDLQLLVCDNGEIRFVFSALASPNGTLYNPKKAHKPLASGRVYEKLFVRHWDTYLTDERSSIFSGTLKVHDKMYISTSEPKNLLPPGSGLETPVQPFGGIDDFHLGAQGHHVVFVSKNPYLNPANNTQSLVYIVSHDGTQKPTALNTPDEHTTRAQGASSSPKFSPDGAAVAYLQMSRNGYESDINKIYIFGKGHPKLSAVAVNWDVSPTSLAWSPDGKYLYVTADNLGRHKLYRINVETDKVEEIYAEGTVSSFAFLPSGKLLLSISTFVSSPRSYVYDPSSKSLTPLQPQPAHEKSLSHAKQVDEFWFPGADEVKVHGWIVKPSYFDPEKKYRMAFFIHGGPQGAWTDGWSTRWNPAVFAEAGWVVVAINPTGSTGYGQTFVDAIAGQWGGKPYFDLKRGVEYLLAHPKYKYIDAENMVALGASYGGYMINYIQGRALGRKFNALVCHDGVFSTLNQYSSEELYFPQHDFKGTLWSNRRNYERWDPAQLINNWATPQMVIHGELDYRLPISEGLAVFNILQEKGIPSKFLHFPDENHWVLKPENSLMWHNEVLEWIERWTTQPKQEEKKKVKVESEKWVVVAKGNFRGDRSQQQQEQKEQPPAAQQEL
ncbi:Alpha/Beta hydrolase protein, partial [Sphaerosporella brunnea]